MTDLDDNTGKNHGSCRWCLAVSKRKPRMHWNERHLDRKATHDGKEHPPLRACRKSLTVVHQGLHAEVDWRAGICGVTGCKVDESDKRDHRPNKAVDPKFDSCRTTVLTTPDGNDQEQRNQGELVADVEEDHITRQEREHDR